MRRDRCGEHEVKRSGHYGRAARYLLRRVPAFPDAKYLACGGKVLKVRGMSGGETREAHTFSGVRNFLRWLFAAGAALCWLTAGGASASAEESEKPRVHHAVGPVYFWTEDLHADLLVLIAVDADPEATYRVVRRAGAVAAPIGEGQAPIKKDGDSVRKLEIPIKIAEPAAPTNVLIQVLLPGFKKATIVPATVLPVNYPAEQLGHIGIGEAVTAGDAGAPLEAWVRDVQKQLQTRARQEGRRLIAGPRDEALQARTTLEAVLIVSRPPDDARESLTARPSGRDWMISVPASWRTQETLNPTQQYELLQLLTEVLTETTP